MANKLNWQRLQVSLNNFKINKLMSYTDIQNKLKLAINNKDQKDSSVQKIVKLIKDLNHKDDFVLNTKHNQARFKGIQKLMATRVGYAKVEDPTTKQLNQLFKRAKRKSPKAMKQFNLNAHKKDHLSAQQAMLKVIGQETQRENKSK